MKIIKMILKYKRNQDETLLKDIITLFGALKQSYINKVPLIYKEDFNQELNILIYKIINRFKFIKYVNEINDLFNSKITSIYSLNNFVSEYGNIKFHKALTTSNSRKKLINKYNLFYNENQFIKYLNKSFNNKMVDYLRMYKSLFIERELFVLQLNLNSSFNIGKNNSFNNIHLTKKEIEFLNNFIGENCIRTEKEVGKILGISQQAVNKRKSIIINKYRKL